MKRRYCRKLLALSLSVVLAASLAACGSSDSTSDSSDTDTEAVEESEEDSEEETEEESTTLELVIEEEEEEEEVVFELNVDVETNTALSAETTQIVNLETEGKENPYIDDEDPTFSWQMTSDAVGVEQAGYQITVLNLTDGSTAWDSGTVESGESVGIVYEGDALTADTDYSWTVTVTDTFGNTFTSEAAYFSTGLMDTSLDAWDGAQWIGADELSVDAASQTLFGLSFTLQIPEGSTKASVVFGADDYRMTQTNFNPMGLTSELNYYEVEFDFSNVSSSGGAVINVYRVGFFEGDSADEPLSIVSTEEGTSENLDEVITDAAASYEVEIEVIGSAMDITINGEVVTKMSVTMNDLGGDSSYMTFPNLNSIGFAAKAGETAVFTDYEVINVGYGTGTLFGAQTGATYSIWDGLEGLSIDGSTITVSGGEEGILVYADPSYASEPYLRKDFETDPDKEITEAKLYISAQGIYNFYINGEEIAEDEWFNPGITEYREEIGYNIYDVTDYVVSGANAMGGVLGQGWWTGNVTYEESNYNYYADQEALLVKLVVTYTDGTTDTIVTDESWEYYGDGPVVVASLYNGERYDATKEAAIEGYTEAGYDSSAWRSASVVETRKQFDDQEIVLRTDEPVQVINTLTATSLGETVEGSGSYLYDMGENVAGVPQITIPAEYAEEGAVITIRVAEILYPDLEEYEESGVAGTLLMENYRAAQTTDFLIMGDEDITYTPDLTYHGYRYIEITGLSEELPEEYVQMLVLSSIETTSTYESSNELANRLYQNVLNSEASNYLSLPTDCPQRNERMGWSGDAQVFAYAGALNSDTYQFMRQWLKAIRESQGEDGMTKQYAPAYFSYDLEEDDEITVTGSAFGITWNCVIVTVPYYLYEIYGDTTIIEENIEAIYAYMENLESNPLEDGSYLTKNYGTLADHLSIATTNNGLLGNAVYVYCLEVTSYLAEAIGDTEQAEKYEELYKYAKAEWNARYIDSETGKTQALDGTIVDTQASYATPLNFGVVSQANLEKVLANYVETIVNPADVDGEEITPYTLTTGFNATPNVLNALSDYGYADVAYTMFETTDYASWLYPVTQGATSIWERWNSYTEEGGFNGNNAMNSFNHYSLGAVSSWMIDTQVGIKADEDNPGFKHFILQPTAGGSYTYLTGSFESSYGTIVSAWTAEDGEILTYDCTVPANTTATLYLQITEEQAEGVEIVDGVTYVGMYEHNGETCARFELASGSYSFSF